MKAQPSLFSVLGDNPVQWMAHASSVKTTGECANCGIHLDCVSDKPLSGLLERIERSDESDIEINGLCGFCLAVTEYQSLLKEPWVLSNRPSDYFTPLISTTPQSDLIRLYWSIAYIDNWSLMNTQAIGDRMPIFEKYPRAAFNQAQESNNLLKAIGVQQTSQLFDVSESLSKHYRKQLIEKVRWFPAVNVWDEYMAQAMPETAGAFNLAAYIHEFKKTQGS